MCWYYKHGVNAIRGTFKIGKKESVSTAEDNMVIHVRLCFSLKGSLIQLLPDRIYDVV